MITKSSISPKFTLGNQYIYWAYLKIMNRGLLRGVWEPKSTYTEKFSPNVYEGFSTVTQVDLPLSSLPQCTAGPPQELGLHAIRA